MIFKLTSYHCDTLTIQRVMFHDRNINSHKLPPVATNQILRRCYYVTMKLRWSYLREINNRTVVLKVVVDFDVFKQAAKGSTIPQSVDCYVINSLLCSELNDDIKEVASDVMMMLLCHKVTSYKTVLGFITDCQLLQVREKRQGCNCKLQLLCSPF
ncbi:Hypothetical_protein [Hexamita inflata]|uniref:Hypothetical_protein n=1 Tax=Hexamita inflata TaxID=28002 RepID=A0ABP1HQ27_9EUKA